MAKYRVIAGAVPMLHDRLKPAEGKAPKAGDILDEAIFKEGEIGDLIKEGFIEQVKEKEVAKPPKEEKPAEGKN